MNVTKYSPGYQTTTLQTPHRDVLLNLFIWYPTDDDGPTELIGQNGCFIFHHQWNALLYLVLIMVGGSTGKKECTTSRDSLPERTVMIWERAKDLTEILNWAENPTIESLDTANISVAGADTYQLQVSKAKFIEYCDRNADIWDCGWPSRGGVDFTEIIRIVATNWDAVFFRVLRGFLTL